MKKLFGEIPVGEAFQIGDGRVYRKTALGNAWGSAELNAKVWDGPDLPYGVGFDSDQLVETLVEVPVEAVPSDPEVVRLREQLEQIRAIIGAEPDEDVVEAVHIGVLMADDDNDTLRQIQKLAQDALDSD